MGIKTRILVLSDTHGLRFKAGAGPTQRADVAIHCGGLTRYSTLEEMRRAMVQLKSIDAPLKLVIGGCQDFSLDIPAFLKRLSEAARRGGEMLDSSAVKKEFGEYGEARKLLKSAHADGLRFLDEGTYRFHLDNGARLKVFASPYTPASSGGGHWGFQYADTDTRAFDIEPRTNVVMTHGPPRGIMDLTADRERMGCRHLFAAVARAQPQVHCFGRVHGGWGARLAEWRRPTSAAEQAWAAGAVVIESLATMAAAGGSGSGSGSGSGPEDERLRRYAQDGCCSTSHCADDGAPVGRGRTLFVNAALQGADGELSQLPWLVDLELPASRRSQPGTA